MLKKRNIYLTCTGYDNYDSVLALCESAGNQTDRQMTTTHYNIHIEHIVHINRRYKTYQFVEL